MKQIVNKSNALEHQHTVQLLMYMRQDNLNVKQATYNICLVTFTTCFWTSFSLGISSLIHLLLALPSRCDEFFFLQTLFDV